MQQGPGFSPRGHREEHGYLKVRVPGTLQHIVNSAVDAGDYASMDAVMLEALQDWAQKRHRELRTLLALHERAAQAMRTLTTKALPPSQREQLLRETRELLQRGRTR
jgi:Arc/MetJ-type ribon-helix-helix transcriptional regulator